MTNERSAIEVFRARILFSNCLTTRQVEWHEAGHMLFWRAYYPNVKVKYGIRGDGYPCVSPVKPYAFVIDELSPMEAAWVAALKLGGIAAEAIMLNLANDCDAIAEWLSDDYVSETHRIDWEDDLDFGGDISQVLFMLERKAGLDLVKPNFLNCMTAAVSMLNDNRDELEREANKAFRLFSEWRKNGKWHL